MLEEDAARAAWTRSGPTTRPARCSPYTDGNGKTTTYTYNTLGRLTTITEPGPGSPTIHYGYDSAGDVTTVTDAVGDTTTYTYDQAGRVLTEENPVQAAAGKDTAFTYDADGNLLTATDANGHTTTYSYNSRDEPTSVTDPMDRVTSYGYDPAGNVTTVTDPAQSRDDLYVQSAQ